MNTSALTAHIFQHGLPNELSHSVLLWWEFTNITNGFSHYKSVKNTHDIATFCWPPVCTRKIGGGAGTPMLIDVTTLEVQDCFTNRFTRLNSSTWTAQNKYQWTSINMLLQLMYMNCSKQTSDSLWTCYLIQFLHPLNNKKGL